MLSIEKFVFLNLIMGEYEKPTISGFIEGGELILNLVQFLHKHQ